MQHSPSKIWHLKTKIHNKLPTCSFVYFHHLQFKKSLTNSASIYRKIIPGNTNFLQPFFLFNFYIKAWNRLYSFYKWWLNTGNLKAKKNVLFSLFTLFAGTVCFIGKGVYITEKPLFKQEGSLKKTDDL